MEGLRKATVRSQEFLFARSEGLARADADVPSSNEVVKKG